MLSKILKPFTKVGKINEIKYFSDKYLNKLKVNSPLVNFSRSERVLWRGRFDELRTLENISPCGMSAAFFPTFVFPALWTGFSSGCRGKATVCHRTSWRGETEGRRLEKNRICVPPRVERGKQKERQRMEIEKKKVDSEIRLDYIRAEIYFTFQRWTFSK